MTTKDEWQLRAQAAEAELSDLQGWVLKAMDGSLHKLIETMKELVEREAMAEQKLDKIRLILAPALTPEEIGRSIRKHLLSLRAPEHSSEDEDAGIMSYATDALRRKSLDTAGVCWKAPGEMAPACGCEPAASHPMTLASYCGAIEARAKMSLDHDLLTPLARGVIGGDLPEMSERLRRLVNAVLGRVAEHGCDCADPENGQPHTCLAGQVEEEIRALGLHPNLKDAFYAEVVVSPQQNEKKS